MFLIERILKSTENYSEQIRKLKNEIERKISSPPL